MSGIIQFIKELPIIAKIIATLYLIIGITSGDIIMGISMSIFVISIVLLFRKKFKKFLLAFICFMIIVNLSSEITSDESYEVESDVLTTEELEAQEEEIKAEEEAKKAEEEARLAEEQRLEEERQKKIQEEQEYYSQFDWYDDKFGVKIDKAYTDSIGTAWIEGRLMPFKKDYSYVQIQMGLLSSSGNAVGTVYANIAGLAKGQTWQFKAMGVPSAKVGGYNSSSIKISAY